MACGPSQLIEDACAEGGSIAAGQVMQHIAFAERRFRVSETAVAITDQAHNDCHRHNLVPLPLANNARLVCLAPRCFSYNWKLF